jgi:nitrate/nitrite transporter NarK
MAVPEERQASAQGLIGAAQALAAGLTAGAIGAIYEGSGRTTSYTVAAIVMIVFVVAGMWLAKDFWRSNRHRHRHHAPEPQRVTARRRDR